MQAFVKMEPVVKTEPVVPLQMFESRASQRQPASDHLSVSSPLIVCDRCGVSVHQSELFD